MANAQVARTCNAQLHDKMTESDTRVTYQRFLIFEMDYYFITDSLSQGKDEVGKSFGQDRITFYCSF